MILVFNIILNDLGDTNPKDFKAFRILYRGNSKPRVEMPRRNLNVR